jgi:hypothetical protein
MSLPPMDDLVDAAGADPGRVGYRPDRFAALVCGADLLIPDAGRRGGGLRCLRDGH